MENLKITARQHNPSVIITLNHEDLFAQTVKHIVYKTLQNKNDGTIYAKLMKCYYDDEIEFDDET